MAKFMVGQTCIIKDTCDENLDGQQVRILGDINAHFLGFYIVDLETPYMGQTALTLIEGCLELHSKE